MSQKISLKKYFEHKDKQKISLKRYFEHKDKKKDGS